MKKWLLIFAVQFFQLNCSGEDDGYYNDYEDSYVDSGNTQTDSDTTIETEDSSETTEESTDDTTAETEDTADESEEEQDSQVENFDSGNTVAIEEGQITLHSVSENTITKLVDYDVEDALKSYQADTEKHQEIWNQLLKVSPKSYLDKINQFAIFAGEHK